MAGWLVAMMGVDWVVDLVGVMVLQTVVAMDNEMEAQTESWTDGQAAALMDYAMVG